MQRNTNNGTTDQVISRVVEPSICCGWCPGRRRYLAANTRIMMKMEDVTAPVTTNKKTNSPSTLLAKFEAPTGQSRKLLNMLMKSVISCQAVQHKHQATYQNHGGQPCEPQYAHDHGAIFSCIRVVVKAVQQHLIHDVPNL